MKQFVYIMATFDNTIFHVGYGKDIEKIVKFYKGLPNMLTNGRNRLVYFEQIDGPDAKEMAIERFEEISSFPWDLKAALISGINPDIIELKIGVNVEL